jgi:hypothetical protein
MKKPGPRSGSNSEGYSLAATSAVGEVSDDGLCDRDERIRICLRDLVATLGFDCIDECLE